jgi:hypothetical protein
VTYRVVNITLEGFTMATGNEETNEYVAQCNGCDTVITHRLSGLLYSEGVRYVAEKAGAYWLIDAIFSHVRFSKTEQKTGGFECWRLKLLPEGSVNKAILTCDDGNGRVVCKQLIPFTDFPFGDGVNDREFKLYRENGLLLLPQER